jgi:hypothetical protein
MRYEAKAERGPDEAPRRTKMLRFTDMDGWFVRYEEWWLDEDGYPSHTVDADEKKNRPAGRGPAEGVM